MNNMLRMLSFVLFFSLLSCEKDWQEELKPESLKQITLQEFESKTGLSNFKEQYKNLFLDESFQARNPDGTYELSDFEINTDVIKELVLTSSTSYSFIVEPKIRENRSIFNLIVFEKNNQWYMSILELLPTDENFQKLLTNQTTKFEGNIRKIFDNSVSNSNPEGAKISISYHCTRTGPCAGGVCDMCGMCMTFYSSPNFDYTIAEPTSPGDVNVVNVSGGGSGFVFSPNVPTLGDYYILSDNITNFWNTLSAAQQQWAETNWSSYLSIIEYLQMSNFSNESSLLVLQLINISLLGEFQLDFNQSLDSSNSLNFNNTYELNDFFDNIDEDGSDFEYQQNQNQKTAKLKIQLVGPFGGIQVEIKQTMSPVYSISEITSNPYGFTVAFGWEQTSSNYSIDGNIVTINVFGNIHYNCVIDGVGTLWSTSRHYQIKINKADGTIISAVRIN